jgi:site-specific DNA recombinase
MRRAARRDHYCFGRQQKRTECTQRAMRIEIVEEQVAAYYKTVQLPEDEIERLRAFLGEQIEALIKEHGRERESQERRLRKLEGERQKLLDARYADAIPLDLLDRAKPITTEIASAEGRLAGRGQQHQGRQDQTWSGPDTRGRLRRRLCRGWLRRQFNLAFFRRLLVDEDDGISGGPFDTLLGPELRAALVAREADVFANAVHGAFSHRNGPQNAPTPAPFGRKGFRPTSLVRSSGLKPPRAVKPTRPSTRSARR